MPLCGEFPTGPYAVLDPNIGWYPGQLQEWFAEDGYRRERGA